MQSPQNQGQGQGPFGQQEQSTGYGQAGYNQPGAYGQPTYGQPGYGSPIPSPTAGYGMEGARIAGKRTLKRIDPGSAFKIGAVTYALMWAVLGLPYVFLFGALMSQMPGGSGAGAVAGGGAIMLYLFGLIGSAIGGGIGGVITAFVYNLCAGWVGGLEIEVV